MTKQFVCKGIVQGIGFRPTALRLATELGITGTVCNTGGNVTITANGNNEALDAFIRRLTALFAIQSFTEKETEKKNYKTFEIIHSTQDSDIPFLTPDLATCPDCTQELFNSKNRRYLHPFISCVNCGPRYTIQTSIPYDRENTSMGDFPLCADCCSEYTTPADRRCHAQTIACNHCGPVLSMNITECAVQLRQGAVVAVKGIGGYHLCADAHCAAAAEKIRKIKGRETKPFAVMFRTLEEIKEFCTVSAEEAKLLTSPARPIVLLKKKKDFPPEVCGGSARIGAFLPCNPIQILLLEQISPLVMTSANRTGAPILTDDAEIQTLDVPVLSHNRKILTPLDDSVMQVLDRKGRFIRRARGYVPLAIDIGKIAGQITLCMGGDLKSTFAYHAGTHVFLSQPFGDLEDADCLQAYQSNLYRFAHLHGFTAEKVVADKHPSYISAKIRKPQKTVQHHMAHSASVIAEHQLQGDVLCFAFDGTGYGDDGAIWGSEVFLFDGQIFHRCTHLDYTKMPASDEVAKDADLCLACYMGTNPLIEKAKKANINMIENSSMGRLFDAVAALLDICHQNTYEGECAEKLEAAAAHAAAPCTFTPSLSPVQILNEIQNTSAPICDKALGFHQMLAQLILQIAKQHRIAQIALSGGVFNNKILTENTLQLLRENGFSPYINEQVPTGDGGIALGQAYMTALEE